MGVKPRFNQPGANPGPGSTSIKPMNDTNTPRNSWPRVLLQVTILVLFVGLTIGAGWRMGVRDGREAFRAEAKEHGFAWHSRETGEWVWKTKLEVQDISLRPVVAVENELQPLIDIVEKEEQGP